MSVTFNFAGLSHSASVDQQTGSMSIFDLIEEVQVPEVPVQLPSFVISIIMMRTDFSVEQGRFSISHIPPEGDEVLLAQSQLQFSSGRRKLKVLFRFGNLPLEKAGIHQVKVTWEDKSQKAQIDHIFDFDVSLIANELSEDDVDRPEHLN